AGVSIAFDAVSLHGTARTELYPLSLHDALPICCYDCHSNYTRYPWYSSITPVNYWLADHVKEGTEHLNLSKWSDYSVKKKDHKRSEEHTSDLQSRENLVCRPLLEEQEKTHENSF